MLYFLKWAESIGHTIGLPRQSFTAYGYADDGCGVVKADGGRGEEEWWLKVGGFCLLTTLLLK